MANRPHNIGIKAMKICIPNRFVCQNQLETHRGFNAGKYTIGLGQANMSICSDREDTYSLALTTASSLLTKYTIPRTSIGRLEVGTETLLDKAKSCKTVLMQLFSDDNPDIEGADTYNACYGGTNALFNAMNWIASSAWDGRDAIVVAVDIALYNTAAARPTGGAGCAGGDGVGESVVYVECLSNRCYIQALDSCYQRYLVKRARREGNPLTGNGTMGDDDDDATSATTPIDGFDHFVFHAPNCKLVASLYSGLASLLCNVPSENLQGKRVGMFSYGSGLASSMFSLRIRGDVSTIGEKLDLRRRLDERVSVPPEVYDEICKLRERAYQQKDFTPKASIDDLVPGTYYLARVDEMFRREYAVKE